MTVKYIAYYPMPGVDREEYRDWLNIGASEDMQAYYDISAGNVPAGMVLIWHDTIFSVWSDNKIRRMM